MRRVLLCSATVLAVASAGLLAAVPASAATHYANCTALHRDYPHGVGRKGAHDHVRGSTRPVTTWTVDTAVYNANTASDRDHDGIACEKA